MNKIKKLEEECFNKITPISEIEFEQKDWSNLRRNLYNLRAPTPTFGDHEKDKEFYSKLEEEYKKRGEW